MSNNNKAVNASIIREFIQRLLDPDLNGRRVYVRIEHTEDSDCTLDECDVCIVCGVYHGDPCPVCGGRGYHNNDCKGGTK